MKARVIFSSIGFLLLVGCSSTQSDLMKVYTPVSVEETDNSGILLRRWYPVDGSVEVNTNTKELTFIDSHTGATLQFERDYILIVK